MRIGDGYLAVFKRALDDKQLGQTSFESRKRLKLPTLGACTCMCMAIKLERTMPKIDIDRQARRACHYRTRNYVALLQHVARICASFCKSGLLEIFYLDVVPWRTRWTTKQHISST